MDNIVRIQLTGKVEGYLDLTETDSVSCVLQASDIRDLTAKTGSTSRTLKLADTKNNHNLLSGLFDINAVTGKFDINKKIECYLLEDDVSIMDNAVFQLTKVNKKKSNTNTEQSVGYEGIVRDLTADFLSTLGNKELTELKFDDLDHFYKSENVINSFSHTQTDGYKYLMPLTTGNKFNLSDFRMGIYAKTYLDRIFASSGMSYDWQGMTDADTQFDKIVIPYNGEVPKLRQEIAEFHKVEANNILTQQANMPATTGAPVSTGDFQLMFPNEVIDLANSFDPITGIYLAPFYYLGAGNISFELVVDWELELNNNSIGAAFLVMGAASDYLDYFSRVTLGKNGVLSNAGYANLSGGATGSVRMTNGYSLPSGTSIIDSGVKSVSLAGNLTNLLTQYKLGFAAKAIKNYYGTNPVWRNSALISGTEVLVDTTLRIKSVKLVVNASMSELGYGQRIYANDFVPKKIKQSDFIKGVLTANNLMIAPDSFNTNKLVLKSRDKYFDEGKAVNWTDKIAEEKDKQIVFLPSLTNKKILLTYKEDKDDPNKWYKEGTNEIYGQVEFTFDSEHVKETDRKEIIFSPTPVTVNDFGAVVPMITGAAPKTNIRMLFDGGEFNCGDYFIIDYVNNSGVEVGNTYNKYPSLSHFNAPFNPTFDINFAICDYYYYNIGAKTNNNLFNLKWRRTVNQINEGKMFIAYFNLNKTDISKMKLSDRIEVDNAYFNINKIEYNANSKAPTKVELITVDSEIKLSNFKVKYPVLPHGGDVVIFNSTKEIVKKNNSASNVVLSRGDVEVKGKNNIVGEFVNSATIYGDGNSVNTPLALIVGDGIKLEKNGIGTENLLVTGEAEFENPPLIGGVPMSSIYQPLDSTLTGLASLDASLGYVVQTALDTFVKRQIVGTAGQINIVDGLGTVGNTILSLDATLFTNISLWRVGSTGIGIRTNSGFNDTTSAGGLIFGGVLGSINQLIACEQGGVLGGVGNIVSGGNDSVIIAGDTNKVTSAVNSIVAGGNGNEVKGNNSAIVGGVNGLIEGFSSAILAGQGNSIAAGVGQAAILAGLNLVATQSRTAYTEKLNIKTLNGTTGIKVIAVDSNGYIVDGTPLLPVVTGTTWGSITGTLSSQTDLNSALNGKQPLATALTNWAAYNSNGIVVQSSASSWVARTIIGTAGQISVSNGDGVSGNPVISLDSTITTAIASIPNVLTSVLSSDFNKNSNTTLSNNGLSVPLVSGKTYKYEVFMPCKSDGAGGIKVDLYFGGSSILFRPFNFELSNTTGAIYTSGWGVTLNISDTLKTSTNAYTLVKYTGTISPSANNDLTVRFAQNTSNASTSKAYAGSFLKVTEL